MKKGSTERPVIDLKRAMVEVEAIKKHGFGPVKRAMGVLYRPDRSASANVILIEDLGRQLEEVA